MSEIRNWLFAAQDATLSTLAAEPEIQGFPFGSLTPFALRADGTPFIFISAIAQHTKNLARDPRCSLFVRNPAAPNAGEAQATWRLTVLANARRIDAQGVELDELAARYRARVPDMPSYGEAHDFAFFELIPRKLRAIGGFGAIRWHEPSVLLVDPQGEGWREGAAFVIEHMNSDHEDSLRDIVAAQHAGRHAERPVERPERAQITAVETAGFLVRTQAPDALHYIPFGRDVAAKEARDVFVKLAHAARGSAFRPLARGAVQ